MSFSSSQNNRSHHSSSLIYLLTSINRSENYLQGKELSRHCPSFPLIPFIANLEQTNFTKAIMHAPAGIFGAIAGLVLLAAPAAARTWAGSVDMMAACSEQYGGGWTATLSGSSGSDWHCTDSSGNTKDINVDAYCSTTYGNAAYADPQGGGAYDCGCYWR